MPSNDQTARLKFALENYVKPGLASVAGGFNSLARQQQVLGTGNRESNFIATVQDGGGPALGFFQMEPATQHDLNVNYIRFRPHLLSAVQAITGKLEPDADTLRTNPVYAALMCGIQYLRSPHPLVMPFHSVGQACLWKLAYNGPGKGVITEAVQYFEAANGVFDNGPHASA